MEAIELKAEEMNEAAGGAKKLTPKVGFIIYQIKKGDTLSRIAAAYGCTVNDLLKWNPRITNKNLIIAGDYLYIRG